MKRLQVSPVAANARSATMRMEVLDADGKVRRVIQQRMHRNPVKNLWWQLQDFWVDRQHNERWVDFWDALITPINPWRKSL